MGPGSSDVGGRGRRTRLGALAAGLTLIVSGSGLIAGAAPAGTTTPGIGGRVFEDIDADGIADLEEPGIGSVTVAAFDDDNQFVGSTTTDGEGRWSLPLDRAVRIEVDPHSGDADPWGVESTGWGTPAVAVVEPGDLRHDIGLMDPDRFCGDDPRLVIPCFFGSKATPESPTLRSFPESDGTLEVADQRIDGLTERWVDPTVIAEQSEVGSVNGVATHADSGSSYAAAFAKRFAPLGPLGINGIYRVTPSGAVETFYSSLTPAMPERPLVNGDPWTDPWGPWQIGWTGWSDIDVVDGRLYGINLGDRHLYVWTLDEDGSAAAEPRRIPIPLQGPDELSDRPSGLGSWRGTVYVGGVDTGDRSGTPVPPTGWVQRFDPETMSFPDGPGGAVVTFPLDHLRGCVYRVENTCGLLDLRVKWRRWGAAPNVTTEFDIGGRRRFDFEVNPQPMVADLEFDDDGALIVGMRDRWGDLLARHVPVGTVPNPWLGPFGPSFTRYLDGYAFGDVMRFTRVPGGWEMENNGTASGATGSANSGGGPGRGEFYDADHGLVDGDLYDGLGRVLQGHDETAVGSLALVPGSGEVVVPSFDAYGVFDTLAVRWLGRDGEDNPTGRPDNDQRTNRAAVIQQDGQGADSWGPFGKNNGLGDIELLCASVPRVLGDLVWFDANGNGIQDPAPDAEPGIEGVSLQLRQPDGAVVATVETDADGRYRFIVEPDVAYEVEVAPWEFVSGELVGMTTTIPNAGDRGGADSDAVTGGGRSVLDAAAPGSGGAALNFDIGVVRAPEPPTTTTTTVPGETTTTTTQPEPGPTPDDELDGGSSARPPDDPSTEETPLFLAATGTQVGGILLLAVGLMILGLVLIRAPRPRGLGNGDIADH